MPESATGVNAPPRTFVIGDSFPETRFFLKRLKIPFLLALKRRVVLSNHAGSLASMPSSERILKSVPSALIVAIPRVLSSKKLNAILLPSGLYFGV